MRDGCCVQVASNVELQRCLVHHLKYRCNRSKISRTFRGRNPMMKPRDANLRQWAKKQLNEAHSALRHASTQALGLK
jgi:hypothetical protein